MRRGHLGAGIFLIAVALGLFVYGLVSTTQVGSRAVAAGDAWTVDPSGLGTVTGIVHWTAANTSTVAYLATSSPNCGSPGGVVAKGSGSSGSFTVRMTPGTTYLLYACDGARGEAASFTLAVAGGWGPDFVIGGLAAVAALSGSVLVALGFRRN